MQLHDKKIGITTVHWGKNHGAVLQGYALQKVLADLGYHAEFIDYSPPPPPPAHPPAPPPPLSIYYRFVRFFYRLFFHPSRLFPKAPKPSEAIPPSSDNVNVFKEFIDKYTNKSGKIDQYSQLKALSSDYAA